ERDERADPVRPHHPQQEDHEYRPGALRCDHAGAGRLEARFREVRGHSVELTQAMRWLLRIVLLLGGTVLLVLVAGFCWLYFYTRDLPDISRLAQYAPTTVTQASDPCLGPSTAVPYEAIGANVRSAITAVEVTENKQGILRQTLRGFFGSELQHH